MDLSGWKEKGRRLQEMIVRNAYGVTLGVSLAIIIGTAIFVRWPRAQEQTPVQEQNMSVGAQDENVQRLSDVDGAQKAQQPGLDENMLPSPQPLPTVAPLSMAYTVGSSVFVKPASGSVLREHSADRAVYVKTMDRYEIHQGMDIACEMGSEVVSPMSGTVSALISDRLWGNGIEITHPDGLTSSLYGLQTNAALRQGMAVRAGEPIGIADGSIAYEREDGVHLHWTLRRDGTAVNPREMGIE